MKNTLFILALALTVPSITSAQTASHMRENKTATERGAATESRTERNKALVTRWSAAVMNRDLALAQALVTNDRVIHGTHRELPRGPEGMKQWVAVIDAMWSNTRSTTEDMIAEGDKVVKRSTVYRTYKPNNKESAMQVIFIYRIADGKIAEVWRVADALSSYLQIGAQIIMPGAKAEGSAETEQQIRKLEEERRQAVLHNDTKTLDRLYADDMTTIDIRGNLHTSSDKAAVNLNVPGTRTTKSWISDEMTVSVYGDTAVVTQRARIADVLRSESRSFSARLTHVWVKLNGQWWLVARHATRIAGQQDLPSQSEQVDKQALLEQQDRNPQSEAEARRVISAWNQAVNARDAEGMRDASNFPLIHLGRGKVFTRTTRTDLNTDNWPPGAGHGEGWDHSTIDSVEFVQSGPEKVHALVMFSRYRRDGTRYATYTSLWIITKQDGHWGIQCRSSFAP